jgi:dsDNA-binding SOS-regulon protein
VEELCEARTERYPFFVLGRYLSMSRKDAARYRAEAEKCREAAAMATDSAARLHWEQAERCWLTMAKQAEVVVDVLRGRNQPTRLQKGQWQ